MEIENKPDNIKKAFDFLINIGGIFKYNNKYDISENFDVLVYKYKESKKYFEILVESEIIIPSYKEGNKVIPTVINNSNAYFSTNDN